MKLDISEKVLDEGKSFVTAQPRTKLGPSQDQLRTKFGPTQDQLRTKLGPTQDQLRTKLGPIKVYQIPNK